LIAIALWRKCGGFSHCGNRRLTAGQLAVIGKDFHSEYVQLYKIVQNLLGKVKSPIDEKSFTAIYNRYVELFSVDFDLAIARLEVFTG
jgi:hypothetical protein